MPSPVTVSAANAPLLTLVVLAAGMGSRYGGLKQIDPMGPSGETVLDYTVHDAARAGFGRVLFIIRRDFADAFRASVGERFAGRVQVDYAFQELNDLPEGGVLPVGRVKPWGTGHALWCARAALHGPFAVVNADDFYGAHSLAALAAFLRAQSGGVAHGVPVYAMVGFPLGNTLSEHGAVSRGVCTVAADGALRDIEEHTGILAAEVGAGRRYDPATPVSMNCWGFTPEFLPQLDAGWRGFFAARGGEEKAEFYLPAAVNALVQAGAARVRVLPTADHWFGVTYREDKPRVQAALAELVARGVYPSPLK
jgi:NDP-sugar pyrophosphorylase family protein